MIKIWSKRYNIRLQDTILLVYFCMMYAHNLPYPKLFTICTVLVAGYFFLNSFNGHKLVIHKRNYEMLQWYLLFIVYQLIICCLNKWYHVLIWNNVIQNILFIYICCTYINNRYKFFQFLKIFSLSTLYFAVVVILTSPFSTWGTTNFGGITQMQRNTIGYVLGVGCVLFIFWGLQEKRRIFFFCAAICACVTVLSGSRKGIVQLIIPIVLYVILQDSTRKKVKMMLAVFLLMSIIVFVCINSPLFMDMYGDRFWEMFAENTNDNSVIARSSLSTLGISLFLKAPLFGYGLGASYKLTSLYGFGVVNYFHNNYVELLVCGGIIGFLLYTWKFIKAGFLSYKNRHNGNLPKMIIILVVVYFVVGLGQVTLYYATFYPVFVIILCGMTYLNHEEIINGR